MESTGMGKKDKCIVCEINQCNSCNQYTDHKSGLLCHECKRVLYYCEFCQKKISRAIEKNKNRR